jgi:hypothetical protein
MDTYNKERLAKCKKQYQELDGMDWQFDDIINEVFSILQTERPFEKNIENYNKVLRFLNK